MAINISKKASIIRTDVGESFAIFNGHVNDDIATTYYYFHDTDEDISKPRYILKLGDYLNKRCMQYRNFNPLSGTNQINKIVLLKTIEKNKFIPLLQTIDISAHYNQTDNVIGATFWSNTIETCGTSPAVDTSTFDTTLGSVSKTKKGYVQYQYDSSKIKTYQHDLYDDMEIGTQNYSIFCSTLLEFNLYKVLTQDQVDANVPIKDAKIETVIEANDPIIIQQFNDLYPVVDFANNVSGGGSGMKNHYHIPTIDGTNYAFAVFHPGTAMPQLPWQIL